MVRELGSGGMATVYLAEDLKHRRTVALKVIKPEIAQAIGGERFLREVEVTARLSHPNILPLFDSGAVGDQLYYVMPFVDGESLRARLEREKRLPLDDAVRIAREVSSALGYAHQHGVVHRDIKPENILLTQGVALVGDFGIARAMRGAAPTERTQAATVAGAMLGTPGYMSPEQIAGDDVDGRTDQYALSCVLFEMVTGQRPFAASSTQSLLRMHLAVPPPAAAETEPGIPRALSDVIGKGLEKLPGDRFPTAARYAEALAAALTGAATPTTAPAATVIRPRHNLPRQRTHFIGREKDLAECARLLAKTQLLTITGIGGCGKTRLAIKLAEQLLDSFPDGAWFADLGPLSDGSRVTGTVAAALGIPETAGEDRLETLTRGVQGKRLLMVLDNCEHLLSACADLANRLLAVGDDLRIIATSREGLGVDGERLFGLRSLTVPSIDAAPDLDRVREVEAVKLFVDRAQLAVHDFVLTDRNAAVVADICRRLDGIPLAIELAAARLRVLSPEQIRSKLDDRFRLLTGGSRVALPRHQTLRATIQWSYDLLTTAEQDLLRRLSVFAGGWTLDLATRVADAQSDEFQVLDLLSRLIERSLVLLERERLTEPRYALLETVRQYARELLNETGEAEAVRRRHADAFIDLAERANDERFVRDDYWARQLELEHDNLRTALEFLRDSDSERFLQLAGAIAWFWHARSHLLEGRGYLLNAIGQTPGDPPRRFRARALSGAAQILVSQGAGAAAHPLMEEALQIWRQVGDLREVALALEGIGWTQFMGGEDETAYATFAECLRIQRELGDPILVNRAMVAVAQVLVALSRVDEARPMAKEIIAFSSARGDRRNEHFGWHYMADCVLIEGRCEESLRLYVESLKHAQAIGDRLEIAFEVQGVAMSLAGLGKSADAVRLAGSTFAEWERLGADIHLRFWDGLLDRYIGGARRALGEALARDIWEQGRAIPFDNAVMIALGAVNAADRGAGALHPGLTARHQTPPPHLDER